MTEEKPPLGVMPRKIWLELRENELRNAIKRYIAAEQDIPWEWLAEAVELKGMLSQYEGS